MMKITYVGRVSQFKNASEKLKEHSLQNILLGFVASGSPSGADHLGQCEINAGLLGEESMSIVRDVMNICGIEEHSL